MAHSLKGSLNLAVFGPLYLIILLTSLNTAAQQKAVEADVSLNGNEDPGFVSGSPGLWLLFVIICIVVIVVLTRGRRDA